MIEDKEHKKRMIEKFDFFYKENCQVHIKKIDGEWLNGFFTERKSDKIYNLKEKVKGIITIFVSEISDINIFREIKK